MNTPIISAMPALARGAYRKHAVNVEADVVTTSGAWSADGLSFEIDLEGMASGTVFARTPVVNVVDPTEYTNISTVVVKALPQSDAVNIAVSWNSTVVKVFDKGLLASTTPVSGLERPCVVVTTDTAGKGVRSLEQVLVYPVALSDAEVQRIGTLTNWTWHDLQGHPKPHKSFGIG